MNSYVNITAWAIAFLGQNTVTVLIDTCIDRSHTRLCDVTADAHMVAAGHLQASIAGQQKQRWKPAPQNREQPNLRSAQHLTSEGFKTELIKQKVLVRRQIPM